MKTTVNATIAAAEKKRALTTCVNGHEYTPENTYVKASGHRECRQCKRDRDKRERVKKRIRRIHLFYKTFPGASLKISESSRVTME